MNKNIPLVAAVLLGLLAVGLIYLYLDRMKKEVHKGMDTVSILVAASELKEGDMLAQENVAAREYPQKYVGDRAIRTADANVVMNARLKNGVQRGNPVFWSDIAEPSALSAGLAAVVEKGLRAVTIPVTEITGLAGMLRPNHRVDVLLTFDTGIFKTETQAKDTGPVMGPETLDDLKKSFLSQVSAQFKNEGRLNTVVLLENVVVLATGNDYPEGGVLPLQQQGAGAEAYGSVTLLVTPRQSAVLAYVQEQGKLTLVLRNGQDAEVAPYRETITPAAFYEFISQTNAYRPAAVEVVE